MNTDWREFLKNSGANFLPDTPFIDDFGNAAAELQAAKNGSVVVPLTQLGLLACDGDEAKAFLHNQLTSDINHLGANAVQHSSWCTAKGRMLASFVVWREGEGYCLAVAAELAESVFKRLVMYRLRAKANLFDRTGEVALIGVAANDLAASLAAAGLPLSAEPLRSEAAGASTVIRLSPRRAIIALPASEAPGLWGKLAAVAHPAGQAAWRWLDIQEGLPIVTAATREEFVPQMADFDKIGGVSFHKGCYPGQEVVARTQYLGKVKRHLYRVTSPVVLQAGDDLHSPDNPDQAAGKIVTAAPSPVGGFEALAVVQYNFAATLHLGSRDGPRVEAVAVNP